MPAPTEQELNDVQEDIQDISEWANGDDTHVQTFREGGTASSPDKIEKDIRDSFQAWDYQGDWATSTAYSLYDQVRDSATGNIWNVVVAHTSDGTDISVDINAGRLVANGNNGYLSRPLESVVFDEKTMIIGVGDSTTWQSQVSGAMYESFKRARDEGQQLENIAGTFNFATSGYTLSGFVNDARDTGFSYPTVGSDLGVNVLDSWWHAGFNAASQATVLHFRNQSIYEGYTAIWLLCFGINDLILDNTYGNLSESGIIDYLQPLLETAIRRFILNNENDVIIIRPPNPMVARPYDDQAGFPSATEYPTFGDVVATDEALVEKWNQALRKTYERAHKTFPSCYYLDVYDDIFQVSDTTINADNDTLYTDLVHPSAIAYRAMGDKLVYAINPITEHAVIPVAESRESSEPWVYHNYLKHKDDYIRLASGEVVGIGASYMDVSIDTNLLKNIVNRDNTVYFRFNGVRGWHDASGYSFTVSGNNTRILGVSPPSEVQDIDAGVLMEVYQKRDEALIGKLTDDYLVTQAENKKLVIQATMDACGTNFYRFGLNKKLPGWFTSDFRTCLDHFTLAIGDGSDTTLDLSTGSTLTIGAASNAVFQKSTTGDFSAHTGKPAILYVEQADPAPRPYHKISGTTSGTADTETTHAHSMSFTPTLFNIVVKDSGSIYFSSDPDGTNFYVSSPETSLDFDIFIYG